MADINADVLKRIKNLVLEDEVPYFTDEQISFYYSENNGNVNDTVYQLLIVKSQSSAISVSGLNTQDTSSYFKRLASKYIRRNSGVLEG